MTKAILGALFLVGIQVLPAQATTDYVIDCATGPTGGLTFTQQPAGSGQWIADIYLDGLAPHSKTVTVVNCEYGGWRNAYPDNWAVGSNSFVLNNASETHAITVPVGSLGDIRGYNVWLGTRITYLIQVWNFPPNVSIDANNWYGGSPSASDSNADGTWDLVANTNAGYAFDGWSCTNSQTPASASSATTTITPTQDTTCTATYLSAPSDPYVEVQHGDTVLAVIVTDSGSGGTPTSYLVTANPGALTCTIIPNANTCTFNGLTNMQEYTITVVARNAVGDSSTVTAYGTPLPPGVVTLSASTASVSPGGFVSFTTSSDPNNLSAMFFDGVMPDGFYGPLFTAPNPVPWEMFGTCTGGTLTFRIYDTTDISPPTWETAYAASVDVTWVGDPNGEGCGVQNQGSGGSGGVYVPNTPSKSDFTVTHSTTSVTVRADYSGDYLYAPTGYVVTLSPGGKTCEIPTPYSSCEIFDLNPDVYYSVSIVAKNSVGVSAALKLPNKVILAIPSGYKFAGQKAITNFAADSAKLSSAFKKSIAKFVKANPKLTAVTCTGYVAGTSKNAKSKALAKARAKAVCGYIKKLKPLVATTIEAATPNAKFNAANRKVIIKAYSWS